MVKYDFTLSATNCDKLNVVYQTNQSFHSEITIRLIEKYNQFRFCNSNTVKAKKFWFGVTSEKFNIYFRRNEVYVEFNATALWKYDIITLREEIINLFEEFSIQVIKEKIMRVDLAVDFYYEKDLIASLRRKNNIELSTQKEAETTYKNNLSITYGKSPENSLIIYNKTAESQLHGSQNFNSISPMCKGNLYRIEYRVGRFLLAQYGISDILTLTNNYFNLLFKLMEKEAIISTHKKIKKNGLSCKNTFNKCRMWQSLITQIKDTTKQDIKKLTKSEQVLSPERKAENVERYLARTFEEIQKDPVTKKLVEQAVVDVWQTYGSESIII